MRISPVVVILKTVLKIYMCSEKCETALKAGIKTLLNKTINETSIDDIFICINSCLRKNFIKWAQIRYSGKPIAQISFIADVAFTDGILKFKEEAENNQLYDGNASVKTVVFTYYNNKLLQNIQSENRLDKKKEKYSDDNIGKNAINEDEGYLKKENQFNMLQQAMEQLEPDDRQIITWRHIENKKPEEIARLLGITTPAASNRIYRCMQRLRGLLN